MRADRTGRFGAMVRLRYRARKAMRATLTVTVRTASGLASRHMSVTVVPPSARKGAGIARKPDKR